MLKSDALSRSIKNVGAMLDDLKKNDRVCVFCSVVRSLSLLSMSVLLPFVIIVVS